ncbi:hypothetical protein BGW36DRAFT_360051 [Talaromyces proteolyticus]|uniref:BZIP domain-containing protein n=1 Tax=Talaromyces proteolyticus TaxID=1131652 RepID=A0AAD4KPA2_9EURO|nr:uncharacterized protein BGW36DRAFT_360051 [Talaromyces proteolyticus]KAH8696196.1 hypothetical protein BGW36DRAFT_360051 [Talaromyces proteolyticus]
MGPRTDPEAIERRRMQNRLAQRKRRLKRAQMAKEEKERQQRLRAAQAASQLTFINDAYMPTNPIPAPQPQQPLPKEQPMPSPGLFEYPPSYDEFFYSSCFPSPQSCYDSDSSPFFNDYPSPALSYAPSTPPLSMYTPSLDEDLSGSFNLDPSILMEPSSGQHPLDAFGLTPLPSTPSPRLQPERHRSTSLPTPLTPPRSVPTSAPQLIDRSCTPLTPSLNGSNFSNHHLYYNGLPTSSPGSSKMTGYFGPEFSNPNMHMLMGPGMDIENVANRGGRIPLHFAVRPTAI